MQVTISSNLKITNYPTAFLEAVKKTLSLPNPLFFKLQRMGNTRALRGVKQNFTYYEITDEVLTVPIGVLPKIKAFVKSYPQLFPDGVEYIDKTSEPTFDYGLTCKTPWRPYQKDALEVINPRKNNVGTLKLSTGWGKTFLAIKLIEHLQTNTLIIVPLNSLVAQFKKEIHEHLGIVPGLIHGKKNDIQNITIASLATLRRKDKRELEYLRRKFGLLIVDEAHRMIAPKSIKVLDYFDARYRYGLTGTPDRTDGQGNAIFFYFGDILIDRKLETSTPPTVLLAQSPAFIPPHTDYQDIIKDQTLSHSRNEFIAHTVKREATGNRKVLILTKRISHYKNLAHIIKQMLPEKIIKTVDAKGAIHVIDEAKTSDDSYDILLGTYSLLSTGIDIPRLDTLVFAGDLRSKVLTAQSIGRILRLHENKNTPRIIDIVDYKNAILNHQAKERMAFYRKEGWLTETSSSEETLI